MKLKVGISLRMVLLIALTAFLIFYATISIIGINYTHTAYEEAITRNTNKVHQLSSTIQSGFEADFNKIRSYARLIEGSNNLPAEKQRDIFDQVLVDILGTNELYTSVWDSRELRFTDKNWTLPYGRVTHNYYRQKTGFGLTRDSMNMDGDTPGSLYLDYKTTPREAITNPYWYSYTKRKADEVLESSLIVPIMLNDNFAGLVGIDFKLANLQRVMDSLRDEKNQNIIIFSNNGDIITHNNWKLIGKNIEAVDSLLCQKFALPEKIQSGKTYNFTLKNQHGVDSVYYSLESFHIANTETPWAVLIAMPLKNLSVEIQKTISFAKSIGIFGLILLSLVVLIFSKTIVSPLQRTARILKQLTLGKVNDTTSLELKGNDEIGRMAESTNSLTKRLQKVANFAQAVGANDFHMEFQPAGDKDKLGLSVIEMRNSLQHAQEEEQIRQKEKEQLNWASEGVNLFNRILRVDNQSLEQLTYDIIQTLTDYLDAQMGGIYLQTENNSAQYELISTVGFSAEKQKQKFVNPNEGEVGRCILEKETIFMNDIPEGFHPIGSGIGRAVPRSMLLVPLIHNEQPVGVLEIESFRNFERFQIDFVERLAETIASTISTVRVNVRTAVLLDRSQKQAEELEQQEEEMRQNMEEMQATQEEAQKHETELQMLIDGFNQILLIAEYDNRQRLTSINENYAKIYKAQRSQMIGKPHKADRFMDETEQEKHKQFWNRLLKGETIEAEDYIKSGKDDFWILEKYVPVKNQMGHVTKVLAIGFEITEQKKLDSKIKQIQEGNYQPSQKERKLQKSNQPQVDLNRKLEVIDLTYLKMVYKKDPQKIYNILKLYYDTLPSQVHELKTFNDQRDYKKLKSKINSLKTKMSYLGLKKIYEDLRGIELLLNENKNLNKVSELLEKTIQDWSKAGKELADFLNIPNN